MSGRSELGHAPENRRRDLAHLLGQPLGRTLPEQLRRGPEAADRFGIEAPSEECAQVGGFRRQADFLSQQDRPDRLGIQETTPGRGEPIGRNPIQKPIGHPPVAGQPGVDGTRLEQRSDDLPRIDLEQPALRQPQQDVVSQVRLLQRRDQDLGRVVGDRLADGHQQRQG